MTSFQNAVDLNFPSKSAMFTQLNLLGASLLRNFLEGCVTSCKLWVAEDTGEVIWETHLSNTVGPLRSVSDNEGSSALAALTHYTFASVIAQALSGVCRNGNVLSVGRYTATGFTLTFLDVGLSLSISYEPAKGGVSYFALTMDGTSYAKPFESFLCPISEEGVHSAVDATLVELRSYLTTKRLRGISTTKRFGG